MPKFPLGLALSALAVIGTATAQEPATPSSTPPPADAPSDRYPGSTAPSSSEVPRSSRHAAADAAANQAQIRQCIETHKAARSTLSDDELRNWCKVQANSRPRDL